MVRFWLGLHAGEFIVSETDNNRFCLALTQCRRSRESWGPRSSRAASMAGSAEKIGGSPEQMGVLLGVYFKTQITKPLS